MQQLSSALTWTLAAMALIVWLTRFWLAARQMRHVAQHRSTVPTAFSSMIDLRAHQKAADYTLDKLRYGLMEMTFQTALLMGWTLLGGLNLLNQYLLTLMPSGLLQQLTLITLFALIGSVVELPLAWYHTFVLEQRHGFNHNTQKAWLLDGLKALAVSAALGWPLAAFVLWAMASTGTFWWFWAWAVFIGFNLLMLVIYPSWIAPLFNRFQPLQDPALTERVTALMQRCGFQSSGLFVMDGSRRSAHANAYFTGFGSAKRVVFFDTLLSLLTPQEVDAVLAHELGHYHHRHIGKRLRTMAATALAAFALLGWLATQTWFYMGLGVEPGLTTSNDALALLLFLLVTPLFSFFFSPLVASGSRKHEFEADAFACKKTAAADLSSALIKLHRDNASTLTPDPIYARFYYSHPPAIERLARLGAA
jgi:STE24 endopeptidase